MGRAAYPYATCTVTGSPWPWASPLDGLTWVGIWEHIRARFPTVDTTRTSPSGHLDFLKDIERLNTIVATVYAALAVGIATLLGLAAYMIVLRRRSATPASVTIRQGTPSVPRVRPSAQQPAPPEPELTPRERMREEMKQIILRARKPKERQRSAPAQPALPTSPPPKSSLAHSTTYEI